MGKKKRGPCIFCGVRTDLTIEDVFPHWAARELRRLHPHTFVQAVSVSTDGDTILKERKRKVGSVAAVKLPRLCDPCNKAMGKSIEKPASSLMKPMLGGTLSVVGAGDCDVIATWGTLKALCYDLIESDPGRVVFQGELRSFFALQKPPPQFKMWIGKFEGQDSDLAWHMRSSTYSPNDYPGFPSGTPHSQVLTLIMGDLIVQSVFVGIRGRRFPSLYERPENDPFTIRVWPRVATTQEWPPAMSITPANLRYFANIPEPLVPKPVPPEPEVSPTTP